MQLVGKQLSGRPPRLVDVPAPGGDVVRSGDNYSVEGVTVEPHPMRTELWLQRCPYFGGRSDYWFAFSGIPTASFASAGSGRPDALLTASDRPISIRLTGLVLTA